MGLKGQGSPSVGAVTLRGEELGRGSGLWRSRHTSLSASIPVVNGGNALHQPLPQAFCDLSGAVDLWNHPTLV